MDKSAENFVRRKFLSAGNCVRRNILSAKVQKIPCTIKSYQNSIKLMLKHKTDKTFSVDKSAEILNRCRKFCPPKSFVLRKLCPPKFCPMYFQTPQCLYTEITLDVGYSKNQTDSKIPEWWFTIIWFQCIGKLNCQENFRFFENLARPSNSPETKLARCENMDLARLRICWRE